MIKSTLIKFVLLLLMLISPFLVMSQNCFFGNNDESGFDNSADPFWANYITGVKVNLPNDNTLLSLNLLGRNTGGQVKMAIYDDNMGAPGNLIVSTSVHTVGSGIISLPVTPTTLVAGDYWLMAIFDVDGGHTYNTNNDIGKLAYYYTFTFGNSFPVSASSFTSLNNYNATYFMEVSCSTVGLEDGYAGVKIKLFPNPSNDYISIEGLSSETICQIHDVNGRCISEFQLSENLDKMNIAYLSKGFYILSVKSDNPYKFRFIKD